ncbi:hypothetical protein [Streptomyces griseoluteus]|uniref:hypothetical protein n=1 Tax=Streptomyces griseoluteus TaxID=29306 RepID=UPI0036FAD811
MNVPDFHGTFLASAVAKARLAGWRKVSASDASSIHRPVKPTTPVAAPTLRAAVAYEPAMVGAPAAS